MEFCKCDDYEKLRRYKNGVLPLEARLGITEIESLRDRYGRIDGFKDALSDAIDAIKRCYKSDDGKTDAKSESAGTDECNNNDVSLLSMPYFSYLNLTNMTTNSDNTNIKYNEENRMRKS